MVTLDRLRAELLLVKDDRPTMASEVKLGLARFIARQDDVNQRKTIERILEYCLKHGELHGVFAGDELVALMALSTQKTEPVCGVDLCVRPVWDVYVIAIENGDVRLFTEGLLWRKLMRHRLCSASQTPQVFLHASKIFADQVSAKNPNIVQNREVHVHDELAQMTDTTVEIHLPMQGLTQGIRHWMEAPEHLVH